MVVSLADCFAQLAMESFLYRLLTHTKSVSFKRYYFQANKKVPLQRGFFIFLNMAILIQYV